MGEQVPYIYINGDGNVIGDGNVVTITKQYFTGEYERLRDAYIDPSPVFERVDLDHFVGREWLLAEVDAFLRDHDRGYFILEAEAGLGKTTFMAWLVKTRGYLQHFCERVPGLEGIGIGLKSLAAQLVLTCHLSAWEADGVLPGAANRPDYFHSLLRRAADQRKPGEKIVLVIDALDEAGTPPTQNVLGLPDALPMGVFFIASQRPVPVPLRGDAATTPRCVFHLNATDDKNQTDVQRFLENATGWPGVARLLQESAIPAERLIATLQEKSHGLWMYLHYITHAIDRREWLPLDLAILPDGMTQYYIQYWRRWRDSDEAQWYKSYLPLLTTLAAAGEPISVEQLLRWSGAALSGQQAHRLLNEQWRPFLTAVRGDASTFGLYHLTLKEFCSGQVDHHALTVAEVALVDELAARTVQAHRRFADGFLNDCGGLKAGLPRLAKPSMHEREYSYGLRHLVYHLTRARMFSELRALIVHPDWYRAQRAYDPSGNTYLVSMYLLNNPG